MDEHENVETTEQTTEVQSLEPGTASPEAAPTPGPSLDLVMDLPVRLTVEVGRTQLLMRDVLELGTGSVLELDRGPGEPADVRVNGRLVARADLTSVDDRLAIRVVELVSGKSREAEET